jgi:large repetitive protein
MKFLALCASVLTVSALVGCDSNTPAASSSGTPLPIPTIPEPAPVPDASEPDAAETDAAKPETDAGSDGEADASADTGSDAEVPSYTVSGTITGLLGVNLSIVSQDSESLELAKDATSFAFVNRLQKGATYSVSVNKQPEAPEQRCAVINGSGTITNQDITRVQVTCETQSYKIGVRVLGLRQTGLQLLNNGGDALTFEPNAGDAVIGYFSKVVESGKPFNVSIGMQPIGQQCRLTAERGEVTNADVEQVIVNCDQTQFTLGGTVTGLTGRGFELEDNLGNMVDVAQGKFAFLAPRVFGEAYEVRVKTQPQQPSQICSVQNASGVFPAADVTNVAVSCTTQSFSLGGTVSGLAAGNTIRLVDDVSKGTTSTTADGSFQLPSAVASGSAYEVIAEVTGPIAQACLVRSGAGTIQAEAVNNIAVTCTTSRFRVGGRVTNLRGNGLVLRDVSGESAAPPSNQQQFALSKTSASGSAYGITVEQNPTAPTQVCQVTNGNGVIRNMDVDNVQVACTTQKFKIKVLAKGLTQAGLKLTQGGSEVLSVPPQAGGEARTEFATAVASGDAFDVAITTQPTGQTCRIEGEKGFVGGGDVTSVLVNCAPNEYSIGGSVQGLLGQGLVLTDELGQLVSLSSSGDFALPTPRAFGAPYNVTITSQPKKPSQTCVLESGSGTTPAQDVASLSIRCTTQEFLLGGTVSGLAAGNSLRLVNGTAEVAIGGNGAFSFPKAMASGASYEVRVKALDGAIAQTCTVSKATGVIDDQPVSDVLVDCTTTSFTLAATVTGLLSTRSITLRSGRDEVVVKSDGRVNFPTTVRSGANYNIVKAAGAYRCTLTNAAGVVGKSNVEAKVACDANVFGKGPLLPTRVFTAPLQTASAVLGIAFDGSKYFLGSRSNSPLVVRLGPEFGDEGTPQACNSLRSFFAVGGTLYGRREGTNEIVRALDLSPQTRVRSILQLPPSANRPVISAPSGDVLFANGDNGSDRGVLRFWRFVDGTRVATSVNLQGWGKDNDEAKSGTPDGLAAFGSYALTYAKGVVSAWDRTTGERVGQATLVSAGQVADSYSGFSYANGRIWVPVGPGASGWYGYDVSEP